MRRKNGLQLAAALALGAILVLAVAACGPTAVIESTPTTEAGAPGSLPETGGQITATVTAPAVGVTATMTGTISTPETPEATATVSATMEATGSLTGTTVTTTTTGTTLGPEPPVVTYVGLTVRDGAFDKTIIEVPAGAQVAIKFTNWDAEPHNFALYRAPGGQDPIFVGDPITGPGQYTTYTFMAPEPGSYYFQSDESAADMFGTFNVR